jgi:hypothetical protein
MCVKWSHYNGWPTQVKKEKNGLIVMGDLPRWKKKCEVWSHCNGWPTQVEDMKSDKCKTVVIKKEIE